ncbi:hypothetical protein C8A03DRAFT_48234 [Achaetomium macrosporum]|uniref:Uncharacterized protein n=1 Tax=Achaetomium macrosporum TaxID=79813 RepID=A0AAN7C0L6_9PEZI|nr:hypothetical protein C8A03DRAFT_48234 [Achaetomium macrosporum]
MCPVCPLTLSGTSNSWRSRHINILADYAADEMCYIFVEDGDFYKKQCSDRDRRRILTPFRVPDFLSNELCTNLNGYFGCKSSLKSVPDTADELGTLSTWSRILTKKILKTDEERAPGGVDYVWNEMAFFTRWSGPGASWILCIGTPPAVRQGLAQVLNASPTLELQDPFAMLRPLLDEVLKVCDENTWRVSEAVQGVEKHRGERSNFEQLHNLNRHARHLVEVEAVAIETMECLVARQETNFKLLPSTVTMTYQNQAKEHLEFQLQIMKSLKWRARASGERLDSEINLAYNMLASTDSLIIKSITLLTMTPYPLGQP